MKNKLKRKPIKVTKKKINSRLKLFFLFKRIRWYNGRFFKREKIGRHWRSVRLKWKEEAIWKTMLYSNYFVKSYYYRLFLKKLLGSFVKHGKKQLVVSNFFKIFLLIKKFWKKPLKLFFNILYLNLRPILFTRTKHMGRTPYKLPWIYTVLDKKKYNKIAVGWIKKSLQFRKEKTFILRLYSEFKDIYLNKGMTIRQKKLLYFNIYKSRSTLRFLRFLQW